MKVAKLTLFNGDVFYVADCDSSNPLEEDIQSLCKALRSRFTDEEIEQARDEGRMSRVDVLDMPREEYDKIPPRADWPTGIFDRTHETTERSGPRSGT